MVTVTQSTQDKLRLIKQRFTDSLTLRRDEIEKCYQSLHQCWNSENLTTLHRHIHSLKGSSATFGFHQISHQADYVEQRISAFKKTQPDEIELLELHANLATLYALIDNPVGRAIETHETDQRIVTDNLTILLAEDDDIIRDQLRIILEAQQHQVISAANGQEAVELFHQHNPDLILMDVIMPVMDGYQATQEIKKSCKDRFVPVIFLTAMSNDEDLVRCVSSGGDDFLVKPVNPELLHARIFAMQRIRQLHQQLHEYKSQTELELELGRHIFQGIINRNDQDIDNVHYWLNPAGQFSGDMISVKRFGDEDIYIMIGDFTGHGLASAMGAIPAADVFYGGSARGVELADLAASLNRKLHTVLPTGYFFACCFMRYQPNFNIIQILNCGMPPIYLLDKQSRISTIKSSQLSLGILADVPYNESIITMETDELLMLLAYTDGVIELQNPQGEMMGSNQLQSLLNRFSAIDPGYLIQHLRSELQRFRGEHDQDDDITLLQVRFNN